MATDTALAAILRGSLRSHLRMKDEFMRAPAHDDGEILRYA